MRKPRSLKSESRAPIAASLLAGMNRARILADPRLSEPGTVHETSETLQATLRDSESSMACTQSMPPMFTPTILFPNWRRRSQAGRR